MNVSIVLRAFTSLLWIAVLGMIVLAVVKASRGKTVKALSTAILVLAIFAVILSSISAGLEFVQPEERAVVISAVAPAGYREQPLQPGLNWIVPFLENVVKYPISRQTYTMSMVHQEGQVAGDDSISARTSDGQAVLIDSSVIYALDPDQVIKVHIEWQDRYADDLVRPLSRGVIRDAVSQFGVEEVYSSQRAEMTKQINKQMRLKLNENGLLLIDFVLRNITFSSEYAASVETKQIAEQKAQQAKFVVEQRKQEAEQARQVAQGKADATVIEAEGQAEARLIQSDAESKALLLIQKALTDNPELLTYTYITKLAPGVQVMLVPNNVPYILPVPTLEPALASDIELAPTVIPTATPLPTPIPTATP